MHFTRIVASCVAMFSAVIPSHTAADWPQFRGPQGSGVAENQNPPIVFGLDNNMLWKSAIPSGPSSPCIVGENLLLTSFEEGRLETLCVNRRDGKIRWRRITPAEQLEKFHPQEGSPASATPVSDGSRVIVYFASFGLLAYDFDGKELWRLPLPIPRHVGDFGSGCSPIVHDGLVLLNRDQMVGANLLAVRAENGEVAWRTERPEFMSSFGTPVVFPENGQSTVVIAGLLQMKAYDLKTGQERWTVRGLPLGACTTPVVSNDRLIFAGWAPGASEMSIPEFLTVVETSDTNKNGLIEYDESDGQLRSMFSTYDINGDRKISAEEWRTFRSLVAKGVNVAMAVRAGGVGNITDTHVDWKYSRGLPYVASPLVYRNRVYFVKDGGLLTCLDVATGRVVYAQERLGTLGSYYASPVAADGHIYVPSLSGAITVVRAGDTFKIETRNELGGPIAATPAIVDDTLYVRTDRFLFAFSK